MSSTGRAGRWALAFGLVARSSPAKLRAFVRRETRLLPVADVRGLVLHQAADVSTLWRRTGVELGHADPPLPYWAFAWSGGLAIARYLLEHPAAVEGTRVIDIASGSGLCAIVAARLGAGTVEAFDVDPFAAAAAELNARANDVNIVVRSVDLLDAEPPLADVILAGDVCYQETMADRMLDWLRAAASRGMHVLLGDPGRTYLPPDLVPLETFLVRTSHEIEDAELKRSTVFEISAPRLAASPAAATRCRRR